MESIKSALFTFALVAQTIQSIVYMWTAQPESTFRQNYFGAWKRVGTLAMHTFQLQPGPDRRAFAICLFLAPVIVVGLGFVMSPLSHFN
ncbi:conserved hypothetical protein [Paraburkholderia tropica]|uniref:hypothetical protein n=1 Tax=Paraburkholderia tropica TaxID=92647 RepID=UPI001CB076A6|nr:hypothetical protein [Paraburkholderia tropica]CAG9237760.1 conserved hypothetical protein [Paraburkholderia tropica]